MGSITIAMIVIMLLSIMLVVVKGFASKETTQQSIKEIIEDLTPNQILAEYKRQLTTLKMCALGGGLLTLMYAMQFFSGDELNPMMWAFGQWFAVGVGAVVVFAITATQYNLYQDVSGAKTAVFIIIGILVFVFISEIASTAERESELVKSRSSNSPAMQVALSAVNSNTTSLQGATGFESLLANAQAKKAEHQAELKRCNRHASKGAKRVERCVAYETKKIASYQAKVDQYSQSSSQRQNSIAGATTALINQVQVLQQDENQHASIIKFFKQFGITATSAMMFVAFILVNAFELGFHYSGSRVGQLKSALAQIGYDLQTNSNDFEIQKSHMDLLKLRDARKTKEEMEKLQSEIKKLSGGGDANPSPTQAVKEKKTIQHQDYGMMPSGSFWGAGVGLGVDVPLGDTGLSLTPAIGTGFLKPFKSKAEKKATSNHIESAQYVACRTCGKQTNRTVGANGFCSSSCEAGSAKNEHQTMGFIDTNNRPSPAKNGSDKSSTMERQNELDFDNNRPPEKAQKQPPKNEKKVVQGNVTTSSGSSPYVPTDTTTLKNGTNHASTVGGSKVVTKSGEKKVVQSGQERKAFSDTDLIFPDWKKAVLNGDCRLGVDASRQWIITNLGAHTSKQVKKVKGEYAGTILNLLYVRGVKDGFIIQNPKSNGSVGGVSKYLLNTEYDEKFERARKELGRN